MRLTGADYIPLRLWRLRTQGLGSRHSGQCS
jgi:hypothetical protein